MVVVPSATGDLVVNTVGQGTGIMVPSGDATLRYVNNVSDGLTLHNSAGSTVPGYEPGVTSMWTFRGDDEWQTISTSLRPSSMP